MSNQRTEGNIDFAGGRRDFFLLRDQFDEQNALSVDCSWLTRTKLLTLALNYPNCLHFCIEHDSKRQQDIIYLLLIAKD